MAQVISHYTGVVSGGATIYCYSSASNTSTARRVYAGDSVRLPADYASHGRNGMLPTDSPSGWMYYYNISNVTPSYKTVTDPCTPPESVTLSGKTLTISGGAGEALQQVEELQSCNIFLSFVYRTQTSHLRIPYIFNSQ